MSSERRVLIIGADGLRPDLLDPAIMPNVAKLAAQGVRFTDYHAAYPSHTRVNMSTLATGTSPGQHGIVANTILVEGARDDHIIDTGNYRHLDALDAHADGNTLFVPALDEILAEHGGRVAVAGTGSSGSNLLWTRNHRSRIVNTGSAYGIADLYDLREKLGEIPEPETPQIGRVRYATRAVTELFLDDPRNRVIVLWFAEPDASLHRFGLGSPESIVAMREVDAAVGRVLGELDRRGVRDQFDVFFASDHGHSTVKAHNTLREYLIKAANEIGRRLPSLTTASDFIYTAPGSDALSESQLAPLVEWLYAQPWCDVVFAAHDAYAGIPGVLPLAPLWNGHLNERRPLLAVSPSWSHEPNEFGVPGAVASLTTQSALRSSHGSVSPYDMHAVLIASGPSFRERVMSRPPTGATDLLPTMLELLGIPIPDHVDGRVLWEGLVHGMDRDELEEEDIQLAPEVPLARGRNPALLLHRVGQTTYVHGSKMAAELA